MHGSQDSFHSLSSSKYAQEATKQASVPLNNMFGRQPPKAKLRPMKTTPINGSQHDGSSSGGSGKVPLSAMMGGGQRPQNRKSLASTTAKLRAYNPNNNNNMPTNNGGGGPLGGNNNNPMDNNGNLDNNNKTNLRTNSNDSIRSMPMFNHQPRQLKPESIPTQFSTQLPSIPDNDVNDDGQKDNKTLPTKLPILPSSKLNKQGTVGQRPAVQLRGFGNKAIPKMLPTLNKPQQQPTPLTAASLNNLNNNNVDDDAANADRMNRASQSSAMSQMRSNLGSKITTKLRTPNMSKDSNISKLSMPVKPQSFTESAQAWQSRGSTESTQPLKSSSRLSPVPLRPMGKKSIPTPEKPPASENPSSENPSSLGEKPASIPSNSSDSISKTPSLPEATPITIAARMAPQIRSMPTSSTPRVPSTTPPPTQSSLPKPKLGGSKLMAKPRLAGVGTKAPPVKSPFSGNFPPPSTNASEPSQPTSGDGFPRPFVPPSSTTEQPGAPITSPAPVPSASVNDSASNRLPRASRAPRANRTSFSTDSVQQRTQQQPLSGQGQSPAPTSNLGGTSRAPRAPRANAPRTQPKK
jgi:hypothetical protein